VKQGETLHDIAQAEGIRLESLLENNSLAQGLQPKVGEQLFLQKKAPQAPKIVGDEMVNVSTQTVRRTNNAEGSTSLFTLHTVQPKETLFAISKKYAVSVEEIQQWNGLDSTTLKTGQQLRINTKANGNH
jgi:LysM repeat protein